MYGCCVSPFIIATCTLTQTLMSAWPILHLASGNVLTLKALSSAIALTVLFLMKPVISAYHFVADTSRKHQVLCQHHSILYNTRVTWSAGG